MAGGFPLVELGTVGYISQVQLRLLLRCVCLFDALESTHLRLGMGPHGAFWLHAKADSKVISCVHHLIDPVATYSPYRLGQEHIET